VHVGTTIQQQDAQHTHYLNTLINTIRWLVTSTGQYVYIRGYKSLSITMNIYLKGS